MSDNATEQMEQTGEAPKAKRTRRKPKVETPEVETPEVETEKVETPEVETPEVETPEVETENVDGYRVMVKAALLNVRKQPTMASETVCDPVKVNDVLTVTEDADGWGKLATGGYVMLKYTERVNGNE